MRSLLAAVLWLVATGTAVAVDTIFVNGKIITVDDRFSIAQAIAIRGDRIAAVGTNDKIRALATPSTRVVDLQGNAVVPGLIDTHIHFIRAASYWSKEARLDLVRSRKQALEMLAAKAKSAAPGDWVLTIGGWSEYQFDEQRGFTLAELDAIAPNNPLFLQVDYSHAYVNSKALQAANVPVDQAGPGEITGPVSRAPGAAPSGIKIERDASGKATGLIEGIGSLLRLRGAIFKPVPEEQAKASAQAMASDFNRAGLTTVFDLGGGGTFPASYVPVRKLADEGKLTLRVRHGMWITPQTTADVDKAIEQIRTTAPFRGTPMMDLIAVGELVHFRLVDTPTDPINANPDHLADFRRVLAAAAERGWPLQVHAHNAQSIARFLDEMEKVDAQHSIKPLRWQFVHADGIGTAEIERARKLGIALSVSSPMFLTGPSYQKVLGDASYAMPPLRLIQDSGIRYALGTDATAVAVYNPFVTMWWAVTGKGIHGQTVTKQTLAREEALVAYTRNAAYLVFEENNLGSIEPGKLADLVVLDRDLLTVGVDEIRAIRPTLVTVGGKVVWSR